MEIKNIPTYCYISNRKKFWFNINNYRNAHYRTLNKAKQIFTNWFFLQDIEIKKFKKPVEIKYYLHVKKNADLTNVGTVVDKFLQDALVKRGILIDDNCKYVQRVAFYFMGYSKEGKVRVEIKEIDKVIIK